jgi:hypothetical protein|nr:MAG TPA: hypothetical protein [Bacteriophage sp.]
MIQCEGQISIMDLLAPVIRTAEIPCLLHEGQTVYKVVRGDVETHTVQKRTWTCGGNNRGYDLDGDVTWNSQIGKIIFTSREPAERVAQEYLAEYEHILAENIRATGVIAYRYEYRGREIVQSYSILEDGTFYFKYGSMYEHIGKEVEIKKFEEERQHCIERNDTYAVLENYKPQYKNMYKCGHSSWVYAEARYEYIND